MAPSEFGNAAKSIADQEHVVFIANRGYAARAVVDTIVAMRGEGIKIRAIVPRTSGDIGWEPVASFTEKDGVTIIDGHNDEHGQPISTLDYFNARRIEQLVAVAKANGATLVHPGWGFLSENPDFAAACIKGGINWVGPSPELIRVMSDKSEFAKICEAAGAETPTLISRIPDLRKLAIDSPTEFEEQIRGYWETITEKAGAGTRFRIKGISGGGGRGQRLFSTFKEFKTAFLEVQNEAQRIFSNPEVKIDHNIENALHVEIQLVRDKHGHFAYSLRECAIQDKGNQKQAERTLHLNKIIAAHLRNEGRDEKWISENITQLAQEAEFELLKATHSILQILKERGLPLESVSTLETMMYFQGGRPRFSFLEMNTRLQVEHPVTELAETRQGESQIDLMKAQILNALGGNQLSYHPFFERFQTTFAAALDHQAQTGEIKWDWTRRAVAQFRITAFDHSTKTASAGKVSQLVVPHDMAGVSYSFAVAEGAEVTNGLDTMLGAVFVAHDDVDQIPRLAARALQHTHIAGLQPGTNIPNHRNLVTTDAYGDITYTTQWFDGQTKLARPDPLTAFLRTGFSRGTIKVGGEQQREPKEIIVRVPQVNQEILARFVQNARRVTANKFQGELDHFAQTGQLPGIGRDIGFTTLRDAKQAYGNVVDPATSLLMAGDLVPLAAVIGHLESNGGELANALATRHGIDPILYTQYMKAAFPSARHIALYRGPNAFTFYELGENEVDLTIKVYAESGLDMLRNFDSLNNPKINAAASARACKKYGLPFRGEVAIFPGMKDEDFIATLDDWVELGADELGAKDPAGIIPPAKMAEYAKIARERYSKKKFHIHSHDTVRWALDQYARALEAGATGVDVANGPWANGNAQPAAEMFLRALKGTAHADLSEAESAGLWRQLDTAFTALEKRLKPYEKTHLAKQLRIVWQMAEAGVPGGMIDFLYTQAENAGLSRQVVDQNIFVFGPITHSLGLLACPVTPSSAAMGDLFLKMIIYSQEKGIELPRGVDFESSAQGAQAIIDILKRSDFEIPKAFVDLVEGKKGIPRGGRFPDELVKITLKGRQPRQPGEKAPDRDIAAMRAELQKDYPDQPVTDADLVTWLNFQGGRGTVEYNYRYGDWANWTTSVRDPLIEGDKITLITYNPLDRAADDTVVARGQVTQSIVETDGSCSIAVKNTDTGHDVTFHKKAEQTPLLLINDVDDAEKMKAVVNPRSALLVDVLVADGQEVKQGDPIAVIEAAKMVDTLTAKRKGFVRFSFKDQNGSMPVGRQIPEGAVVCLIDDVPTASPDAAKSAVYALPDRARAAPFTLG